MGSSFVSRLDDIDKVLGEVFVKVMGVYLIGNEESLEKDFPSREYLYDENFRRGLPLCFAIGILLQAFKKES